LDSIVIKLNRIQYPVESLGFGKRFGIWVQGCSIHCDGCISKDLWPFDKGRKIPVKALVEIICQMGSSIDGISISGGEPFDQYSSLMAFCSYLKALNGPPVQVFSGYRLDEIDTKYPDKTYTECIDGLIDGPYISHLNKGDFWRGSENQNFYTFEKGNAQKKSYPHKQGAWALNSTPEGEHFFAGIPAPNTLLELENYLKKAGIQMRFEK